MIRRSASIRPSYDRRTFSTMYVWTCGTRGDAGVPSVTCMYKRFIGLLVYGQVMIDAHLVLSMYVWTCGTRGDAGVPSVIYKLVHNTGRSFFYLGSYTKINNMYVW